MLARLLLAFCLIFSLVYCQDNCNVNNCAFNTATDRRGSTSVDVTFGNDLKYSPSCIIVDKGTTINYNGDFSTHPLVAGTYSSTNGKQPASSSSIPNTSSGTTVAVQFNNNGTFPFYCNVHASSGMVGVVYVGPACASSTTPKSSDAGTQYVSFIAAIIAGLVALLY